jgi:hypothetical protein
VHRTHAAMFDGVLFEFIVRNHIRFFFNCMVENVFSVGLM